MITFNLKNEYIKLGQLLKAAGLVSNGGEAKFEIAEGNVKLNGDICTMRGKKIFPGDVVEYNGAAVKVEG